VHLTPEIIQLLAARVLHRLKAEALITIKGAEQDILERTAAILEAHVSKGRKIDEKVRQLMQQYAPQIKSGQIDTQQMYGMMRKQVAKAEKYEMNPEDQVSVLAHAIQDHIYLDDLVDYAGEEKALKNIKATLTDTLLAEGALDGKVRAKIDSLKRSVPEGSQEWDILYHQYMEEELGKKGLS
jgi:uncharacterized protein